MKSKILLPLIAALIAIVCPAFSQNDGAQVSVKIDVVAFGEDIPGLSVGSGGAMKPVAALGFRYSKPVAYSGSNILEISQKPGANPNPAAADPNTPIPQALAARRKENPNLVALALLPPGSKRVTVLVAPGASGTYQTIVIDDDPTKLPYGRLRVHNFSPLTVALNCNKKPTGPIKPKGAVVVSPEDKQIVYELAYQQDGAWITQENNFITVKEDEQVQFVIVKSAASYFTSRTGAGGGFLQTAILRRNLNEPEEGGN